MTPELCFEFCIGAGLDLFGLVGEECRCGASLLNKDVWQMAAPRTTGLLLPLSEQLPETQMECPVRVYHWLGPFVSGGSVPEHLQMLQRGPSLACLAVKVVVTETPDLVQLLQCLCGTIFRHVGNTIYVDSIVSGTDISEEEERVTKFHERAGHLGFGQHLPLHLHSPGLIVFRRKMARSHPSFSKSSRLRINKSQRSARLQESKTLAGTGAPTE